MIIISNISISCHLDFTGFSIRFRLLFPNLAVENLIFKDLSLLHIVVVREMPVRSWRRNRTNCSIIEFNLFGAFFALVAVAVMKVPTLSTPSIVLWRMMTMPMPHMKGREVPTAAMQNAFQSLQRMEWRSSSRPKRKRKKRVEGNSGRRNEESSKGEMNSGG